MQPFNPEDLPLPRSRPVAIAISALAIALIGRLDYATGADTTVIVLYLLPIAFVAWVAGASWGFLAAAASAGLSFAGDALVLAAFRNPLVPYWNAAVQFSVFALFALALAALHASIDREHVASRVDFVTGLSNWRAFAESSAEEIARTRRFGRPLTLVYMDCDDFKQVNDTFGHAEGDRVLRLVAEALRDTTREIDTVARLGGDEFVVLLPETGPDAAEHAVERMRERLGQRMEQAEASVTVSVGVATFLEPPLSFDEFVRSADRLLYAAKAAGGDRASRESFGPLR